MWVRFHRYKTYYRSCLGFNICSRSYVCLPLYRLDGLVFSEMFVWSDSCCYFMAFIRSCKGISNRDVQTGCAYRYVSKPACHPDAVVWTRWRVAGCPRDEAIDRPAKFGRWSLCEAAVSASTRPRQSTSHADSTHLHSPLI